MLQWIHTTVLNVTSLVTYLGGTLLKGILPLCSNATSFSNEAHLPHILFTTSSFEIADHKDV